MSRATAFAEKIKAAFPGVRITDLDRTPAQQRALVARGVTRSTNSQHIDGNGIDLVLPKGVSASAIKAWIGDQGENPGEFLVESGKGKNQGTGAHLHIGLAPKAGKPQTASRQSTFDRVTASRPQKSTVADVFNAYRNTGKPGGMSPQDAAAFENAVNSGQILLPRGAALRSTPSAPVIPKWLVEKHNSHEMDDDPEGRAALQKAVESGEASLPKGMQLKAPPPRTTGETFGMGVRNVMEGAGGLVDIAAAPVNAGINAVAGTNLSTSPFRDVMSYGADKMGLAAPESPTEKLTSGVIEGGTQGLMTAGAGLATSGAKGITGLVAREVAANPVLDTVSGGFSGGSQESARQAGAGPGGQILAALAGGLTPVGVAKTFERARVPKTLPDAVAETPREVMLTPDGELTPHGQDVAARHGATPEQVRQAYDAPPTVQRGAANEGDVTQPQARAVGDNAPPPEAPQAAPQPQEAPIAPEPAPQARAAPEVAPEPVVAPVERVQTANDFGIPLSRGEATKNFDIQAREQALRGDTGPESDAARAFKVKQTEAIKEAVSRYKSALGDEGLTAEERGTAIQDALRDLRDQGQKGVSELYKQARELGEPVEIGTDGIKQAYQRVMVEANVPDSVKAELTQEMARYGLIGKAEDIGGGKVTAENGVTTVKLDSGQSIKFYGEPQTLRLDNAEEFRKVVSDLYRSDGPRKLSQLVKSAVDDAVEAKASTIADTGGGNMSGAMAKARDAHIAQVKTFRSKDVIQDLIDWKKGAEGVTSKLSPEQVVTRAFRSTSDLRKVKAILLGKGNPKGKEAWNALQAHGVATIFDKAKITNQNIGGQVMEAISGAKLRSAIEDFGPDKLKVLLDADQFGQLMKMRRTIEDATIPISGTTNPAGSGLLIMRLFKGLISGIPYASTAMDVATAGVSKVKAAAQKAETVKGLDYTPEKAATETALPGQETKPGVMARAGEASGNFIKAFIDTFKTPESLTPALVAATDTEQK